MKDYLQIFNTFMQTEEIIIEWKVIDEMANITHRHNHKIKLRSFNIWALDVLPGRLGTVLKLVLEAGPHSVRPVNRFRHFRNIYILLHYHSIFITILFSFFRRMTDIKWIINFFFGEMYFYHVYILTDGLKRFVLILNKSF